MLPHQFVQITEPQRVIRFGQGDLSPIRQDICDADGRLERRSAKVQFTILSNHTSFDHRWQSAVRQISNSSAGNQAISRSITLKRQL
jgi:hypothetical protein